MFRNNEIIYFECQFLTNARNLYGIYVLYHSSLSLGYSFRIN